MAITVTKSILWFETTQCNVMVYENNSEIFGEKLYIIHTHHRKTEKDNIRFGTRQQLFSILNAYKFSITNYKEEYEMFMDKLSYFKLD